MNQDRISETIKKIRKENNITQKELADKLGVTYQAVSKWENGKNIPDIEIMKEICTEYNIDINELLDNKIEKKNKYKLNIIILICIIIVLIISVLLFINNKNDDYFKKISSSTENFKVNGSIANINNKTYIYITDISYSKEDDIEYDNIKATLYESYNDTTTKIASSDNKKDITLNNYLKEVTFNIDNYKTNCKENPELYIEIQATENSIVTAYKVNIILDEVCNNNNSTQS